MRTSLTCHVCVVVLGIAGFAASASAQQATTPPIVERVHNPFVVAPDFKVTDVDNDTGQLAGVYVGRLLDDKVLVGGALYWLANGSDTFRLTYGGLLVGWSTSPMQRIRFGVRGLAGVGTARLPVELTAPDIRFGVRQAPSPAPGFTSPRVRRIGVSDDFLVFEPQGIAVFDVTSHAAVTIGLGYRTVALTDALRDRIDGPTGSIGLEFDW